MKIAGQITEKCNRKRQREEFKHNPLRSKKKELAYIKSMKIDDLDTVLTKFFEKNR